MKFLTRLLLLSLCFVLLLGGSSGVALAATELNNCSVLLQINRIANGASSHYFSYDISLGSDFLAHQTSYIGYVDFSRSDFFQYSFVITPSPPQTIFENGKKVSLTFENIDVWFDFVSATGSTVTTRGNPSTAYVAVKYSDDSYEYFYSVDQNYSITNHAWTYSFDFTPSKDVKNVYLTFSVLVEDYMSNSSVYKFRANASSNNAKLTYDVQSEEAGLLSGLIEWVKQIFNKIGEIGTAIAELPAKLWTMIENGLKGLFVPDEQYLATYKDKWDSLLSQRLGAVYQAANYVVDIGGAIVSKPEQNTITFPSVCIDLPDNCSFEFGGWEVNLVPDGFDFLVVAIKTVVGIVCTLMFINGMIKRYDEVMGVEQ